MIIVVMGVSGSGKTTIGRQLAELLDWPFWDADDFHPPANIQKMSHGVPLTDADRAGWLAALASQIAARLAAGQSGVLACSALKQAYRDILQVDPAQVRFVFLRGSYALIQSRMQARPGHYMRPEMLSSQFATLEEPPEALSVDISLSPQEIVDQILTSLV
jgi:carbohydrate kinase (thermoresistant glucokinase family)